MIAVESEGPAVTILIPFYNVGQLLEQALKSAVEQTLRNVEILCINDASKDNSPTIAAAFAAKDARVRVLYNDINQGINQTRCRGVREARGKFLLSLDGDDVLEPDIAEIAFDYAQRLDVDVVEFQEYVYRNGMRGLTRSVNYLQFGVSYAKPLRHLLRRPTFVGNMHRKLVRCSTYRTALNFLGPDFCAARIDMCEDFVHTVAVYRIARSAVWIEKIGYHYHRRDDSLCCFNSQSIAHDVLTKRFTDQMQAFRLTLSLLHHRQRHLLFCHIKPVILRECAILQKLFPPADYATLLVPYLDAAYFGKFFSFGGLLASSPGLLPADPEWAPTETSGTVSSSCG